MRDIKSSLKDIDWRHGRVTLSEIAQAYDERIREIDGRYNGVSMRLDNVSRRLVELSEMLPKLDDIEKKIHEEAGHASRDRGKVEQQVVDMEKTFTVIVQEMGKVREIEGERLRDYFKAKETLYELEFREQNKKIELYKHENKSESTASMKLISQTLSSQSVVFHFFMSVMLGLVRDQYPDTFDILNSFAVFASWLPVKERGYSFYSEDILDSIIREYSRYFHNYQTRSPVSEVSLGDALLKLDPTEEATPSMLKKFLQITKESEKE